MSMLDDDHVYSYSQLASVDECPYNFYLQKIDKDEDGNPLVQQDNFFAEYGTLIHKVLEEWAKGRITRNEMTNRYVELYPEMVKTSPPPYMQTYKQKAYDNGLLYFEDFDEFPGYTVVAAEERFKIDIPLADGTTRPFQGVIDLLLRNNVTGKLVVVDHKSKSLKEFKKIRDEMYRQQYLYSAYVIEKYGEKPEALMFNLFKESMFDEQAFDENAYAESLQWATEKIKEIEERDFISWLEQKDEPDFFCNEICSVRQYCPNGMLRPQPKGKKKT